MKVKIEWECQSCGLENRWDEENCWLCGAPIGRVTTEMEENKGKKEDEDTDEELEQEIHKLSTEIENCESIKKLKKIANDPLQHLKDELEKHQEKKKEKLRERLNQLLGQSRGSSSRNG